MIVAFSVAPSGTGRADGSVHDAVAAAVRIVRESGLPHRTSSMFTEIEGEWDEVMEVVTRCFNRMKQDCTRVSVSIKIDYRRGKKGRIESKIASVEKHLNRPLKKS